MDRTSLAPLFRSFPFPLFPFRKSPSQHPLRLFQPFVRAIPAFVAASGLYSLLVRALVRNARLIIGIPRETGTGGIIEMVRETLVLRWKVCVRTRKRADSYAFAREHETQTILAKPSRTI